MLYEVITTFTNDNTSDFGLSDTINYFCRLFKIYMIQSMTGFGKAYLQLPTKKITVEIKSLNSKGLDLNVRMPSVYREMELSLRNTISQSLERGKIDFSLYIEITGEETTSKINVPIVKSYIRITSYNVCYTKLLRSLMLRSVTVS